jgi:histidinol phosphatase-like PHP family hydrolase
VAPTKDKNYSYDKYKDAIDPILELLVQQGKGLELNTGSFRYGLRQDQNMNNTALGAENVNVKSCAYP